MPLNINDLPSKSSNKPKQLVPKGQQVARLVRVLDLGLQTRPAWKGEQKDPIYQLDLTFEFPNARIEIDGDSKPMWLSRQINLTRSDKGIAKKWLEAMDPENNSRGDFSKLVGTPVLVFISHEEGRGKHEGKTFDRVSEVSPMLAGVPVPELENDPVVFDLGSPDMDVFRSLPEFLQERIKGNLEYDGSKLERLIHGQGTQVTAKVQNDNAPDVVNIDPDKFPDTTGDLDDQDDPFA